MTPLSRDDLLESVLRLFSPAGEVAARNSMSLGAEIEMIPVSTQTGQRVLAQGQSPSGAELLAAMGHEHGWAEEEMDSDPSCWTLKDGRVTFEPGGQIEFSSAVFPTADSLIDALDVWLPRFREQARRMGIALKTIGIEESVSIDRVPLQLQRERYRIMTRYFNSIGSFGVVMMRQTASLQINVDRGEFPLERWRLLNALAPYLVAIFANSPQYDGEQTGHRSYRAHVWRNLDSRRTGIVYKAGAEAERYLEFALNAPVILGSGSDQFPTFAQILTDGCATPDLWETHLSTLFPEIRPRDYFEIRSIDSIKPEFVSAAIALVAGLTYHEKTAMDAAALLGEPSSELLAMAGTMGLSDPTIQAKAAALTQLAIEGCRGLGAGYISAEKLSRAMEFFDQYTLNGRSPGDDSSSIQDCS